MLFPAKRQQGWWSVTLLAAAVLLSLACPAFSAEKTGDGVRAAAGGAQAAERLFELEELDEPAGVRVKVPADPGRSERGLDDPPRPDRVLRGASAAYAISTAAFLSDRQIRLDPRIPYDIPVVYNDMVDDWIRYFQGRGRKYYNRWLERYTKFSPEIKKVLREYKLPEDTIFLAMIESGFSPFALSKSAAGGMWQFIPGTARRYGLKIDFWRDERRDPIKSTRAAAMYLRDLYGYFGSWWLAWAGYNSGEGKIFRALRRYDTDDFWEISETRFLRKETRNYVPKLIAAAVIAKNPSVYGFGDVEYLVKMEYEEVEIPSPTDLRAVASAALADLETIEALNPELRRGCTPPTQPTYLVRVPKGSKERFMAVFGGLPQEQRFKVEQYTSKKGDTLAGVAKAKGVKAAVLAEFNGLQPKASLKSGTELRIPSVYVRDEETEERWDKKSSRSRAKAKKAKTARKVVGSSSGPGGTGG
jgi:membrane-bound lytic murein transglycosylase D